MQSCVMFLSKSVYGRQYDRVKRRGYMTEIHLMTAEHTYWKETISMAEKCSG